MNPKPLFLNLTLIGIIFLTVTGGIFLIAKTVKIDQANPPFRQISLEGVGKAKGEPTVAAIRIGMVTLGKDIGAISKQNIEKMNEMTKAFEALGIAEEDLQTENYSVTPEYTYKENRAPEIEKYRISQRLVVKIRDLTKIQSVLQKAVEFGSNDVSGPEFTIDDEKHLIDQAREQALKDLKSKIKALEKTVGLDFGKLTAYNEYVDRGGYPPPIYYKSELGGGGADAEFAVPAPDIQPGSLELVLRVNATYELE